jgi:hypothetical protein
MDLFVDVCTEMQLREFNPMDIANVINGKGKSCWHRLDATHRPWFC